jgi:hypothetical protein
MNFSEKRKIGRNSRKKRLDGRYFTKLLYFVLPLFQNLNDLEKRNRESFILDSF